MLRDLGLSAKAYFFLLLSKDMWSLTALSPFNSLGKVSPISQNKMSGVPPCLYEYPAAYAGINPACSSPWQAAWGEKVIFGHTPL